MAQRKKGEDLRALVTRLLEESGMSGREFARRASERGYSVSYTTINSVVNGTRRTVTDETLTAISEVFGVNEDTVREAAGAPPRDDTTDPQLLALHRTLTPAEKNAALSMYREYVRTLRAMREQKP